MYICIVQLHRLTIWNILSESLISRGFKCWWHIVHYYFLLSDLCDGSDSDHLYLIMFILSYSFLSDRN